MQYLFCRKEKKCRFLHFGRNDRFIERIKSLLSIGRFSSDGDASAIAVVCCDTRWRRPRHLCWADRNGRSLHHSSARLWLWYDADPCTGNGAVYRGITCLDCADDSICPCKTCRLAYRYPDSCGTGIRKLLWRTVGTDITCCNGPKGFCVGTARAGVEDVLSALRVYVEELSED